MAFERLIHSEPMDKSINLYLPSASHLPNRFSRLPVVHVSMTSSGSCSPISPLCRSSQIFEGSKGFELPFAHIQRVITLIYFTPSVPMTFVCPFITHTFLVTCDWSLDNLLWALVLTIALRKESFARWSWTCSRCIPFLSFPETFVRVTSLHYRRLEIALETFWSRLMQPIRKLEFPLIRNSRSNIVNRGHLKYRMHVVLSERDWILFFFGLNCEVYRSWKHWVTIHSSFWTKYLSWSSSIFSVSCDWLWVTWWLGGKDRHLANTNINGRRRGIYTTCLWTKWTLGG